MIDTTLSAIAMLIEAAGAIIIIVSAGISLWDLALSFFRRQFVAKAAATRLTLGQRLVLALEFLIAADILKTILTPSLEELAMLGGVILIRTVLSMSIAYELQRYEKQAGVQN